MIRSGKWPHDKKILIENGISENKAGKNLTDDEKNSFRNRISALKSRVGKKNELIDLKSEN